MRKFLFGILLASAVLIGFGLRDSTPKPTVVQAPVPYDVTIFIPNMGPQTVVIDSSAFTLRDGCFISQAPRIHAMCNVLEVKPCTEQCTPAGAAPPQPQQPAPTAYDPNARVADVR